MRTIPKAKAEKIAKAYVRNGFSGIKALREVEPTILGHPLGYQYKKASYTIKNRQTQQALRELLNKEGTREWIETILKRNANQAKNYAASNTALDMVLKVLGEYAPDRSIHATVTANLTNEQQDELLNRLIEEARQVKELESHNGTV